MKLLRKCLWLVVLLPVSAFADLVGTWSIANSNSITVSYKDDQHIRMEVGNGTYMVLSKGKPYMVMNQGGALMVMDMAAMGGAMKSFGGAAHQQAIETAEAYDPSTVSIKKTGKSETIAGFKGDVYQVTVKGKNGPESHEIVTSQAPKIVKFQRAFMQLSQQMAQSMLSQGSMNNFNKAMDFSDQQKVGGLLRYEQQMKLVSLEEKAVPMSKYQLPANAIKMSLPGFPQ